MRAQRSGLRRRVEKVGVLLGSLAIVAVCLLVALEVTDEMGWEGRGAK